MIGPGGQFFEGVAEVGEGLDAIELAGLDNRVEGGGALSTGIAPHKQKILATYGDATDGSLHRIVIDAEVTLIEILIL